MFIFQRWRGRNLCHAEKEFFYVPSIELAPLREKSSQRPNSLMVTNNAAMNAARAGSGRRIASAMPGALEFAGAGLAAHYPGALILVDPHGRA